MIVVLIQLSSHKTSFIVPAAGTVSAKPGNGVWSVNQKSDTPTSQEANERQCLGRASPRSRKVQGKRARSKLPYAGEREVEHCGRVMFEESNIKGGGGD